MKTNPAFSKPSEVLGTNWLRKLRTDLFLRTEFTLISLFFALSLFNLGIIAITLHFLHMDIAVGVVGILSDAIRSTPDFLSQSTTTTAKVFGEVSDLSNASIITVIGSGLIATILFGYIATRFAFAPAKDSLAAQKQFIGNIAHELRTPLSIIRANSEILLLQKNLKPDHVTLIESNVEELGRISGIIDNLLTLNAFKHTGAMNFELVNLCEVVTDSIKRLEKLAASTNLTLDADIDQNLPLWGNKSALSQIAMNLIKNAILFTPPKGSIYITAHRYRGIVVLEVRDTGIGIEAGKIGKVFEPFYQVESSRSNNKGSGGLGLAIVSELVKFHHGKISIRSTPNVGTLVRVVFPLKHPGVPKGAIPQTEIANEVTLDFSKS